MKQLWEKGRTILPKVAVAITLLYIFAFLPVGMNQAEARTGESPTLKVRVRHPDGRAVEGIRIELYFEGWLPEEERLVGSCEVPDTGFCEFSVQGLVQYSIRFPDGQQLDPITSFAAGHSGINGLGIVIKEDYTIGFVLSKLNEVEAEANWMLIDDTSESDTPTPIIPDGAQEAAQKMFEHSLPDEEKSTLLVVTQTPAEVPNQKDVPVLIVGGLDTSVEKTPALEGADSEQLVHLELVSEGNGHLQTGGYSDWFYQNYPWLLLIGLLIGFALPLFI